MLFSHFVLAVSSGLSYTFTLSSSTHADLGLELTVTEAPIGTMEIDLDYNAFPNTGINRSNVTMAVVIVF